MEHGVEENPIKPVGKLRERFEALATSTSSVKSGASTNSEHEERSPVAQPSVPNESPRLSALRGLRNTSGLDTNVHINSPLKQNLETGLPNAEALTPTQRPVSPLFAGRLKPPPPPPPDRTASLQSKSSADSVGSHKKPTLAGVYRKPPPPPPLHAQPGHVASLSVGDLVSQISANNGPSFRSLDTS